MGRALRTSTAWLLAMLGAAGWFLMTTASLAHIPRPLALLAGLVGLAVAILAACRCSASSLRQVFRTTDTRRAGTYAALGGILAFWLAPAIILSQRASDAPSGSETLLFSVVAFGVLSVIVSAVHSRGLSAVTVIPAALLSAVGAAAVLANWERPSSFSPLVKYPGREGLMLLAAVVFAIGTLMILRAEKRDLGLRARSIGVLAAAGVAVAVAVPSLLGRPAFSPSTSSLFVLLALTYAIFGFGWLNSASSLGLAGAASALTIAPAAVTALIIAERTLGVRGTDPIVWKGAVPGIAICILGAVALLASHETGSAGRPDTTRTRSTTVLTALGMAAALFAAATLWAPAIAQRTEGITGDHESFTAEWVIPGLESAAGWATFAAGIGALGVSLAVRRGARIRVWAPLAIASIAALGLVPFLGDTTFATWNTWIPSDVQQAYGTEYARLTVSAINNPIRTASAVFSAGVIVYAIAIGIVMRKRSRLIAEERNA